MPRTITAGLAAHLAGEVTTLATLWKVTWQNGTVLAFTDHDEDVEYLGVRYESASGYVATDVSSGCTLEVDNLDLQGALVSPSITEADLRAGLWDYAEVRIVIVNWADLTMGGMIQRVGHLGEVTIERGRFKVELRGLVQAYSTSIVELTTAGCRATFGDTRCGLSLTGSPSVFGGSPAQAVYGSGTITSIAADNVTLSDAARTEQNHASGSGWWQGGKLTWTSGLNNGLSMEIKSNSNGTLVLALPMPYAVQAGDTYTLTAGCDKQVGTCAEFGNVANFRGEPYLRGNDVLIQQGRHS